MATRSQAHSPVIVTFYSLMGGVGGSTTVANCAGLLAAAGKRTLVIDWDLAAPRMHDYLRPFMTDAVAPERGGLIALARQFADRKERSSGERPFAQRRAGERVGPPADPEPSTGAADEPLDLSGHLMRLRTTAMGLPGQVDFLLPTSLSDLQHVSTVWRGWDERPAEVDLAEFADALRRTLIATDYDYVLVDVPYGASDPARAGTELLPDVLVVGFRLGADGIDRTADLVRRIHDGSPVVRVLPVLMRFDPAPARPQEQEFLLAQTLRRFRWLLAGYPDYWVRMRIPDSPGYEGGEKLAVFSDPVAGDDGLTTAYQRLVTEMTGGDVTGGVQVSTPARAAYNAAFEAQSLEARAAPACVLSAPEDRVWADWVRSELVRTGVSVIQPPEPGETIYARRLLVVGASRPDSRPPWAGLGIRPDCEIIALRTSRYSDFTDLPVKQTVDLRWRDEMLARRALQDVFGVSEEKVAGREFQPVVTPRFPRRWVEVRYLPPPNPAFVGRQHELDELRDRLLSAEGSRPYVLYGAPGTGKSQIALEYADRFATDYDQVWWISAQTEQDARATLTKVARHYLAEAERASGDTPKDRPEGFGGDLVATALDMLGDRNRPGTWLLIYDNVETFADIQYLLPSQGQHGHIVVTAHLPDGVADDGAVVSEPGSFSRDESCALLRRIVPGLRQKQATELAALAQDLPLTIGLIAAWIAADSQRRQSGTDVPAAAGDVPHQPEVSVRERTAVDDAVDSFREGFAERRPLDGQPAGDVFTAARTVLDLALETLGVSRHGRAMRLLVELAAYMSPDGISRRLLYSTQMLKALQDIDPGFTDTTELDAMLVRISRLGLAVVDHEHDSQVLMHRLVQRLVRGGMNPHDVEQRHEQILGILAAYCPPDGEVDREYHRETFVELQRHLHPSNALDSRDENVRRWLSVQIRFLRLANDEGSKREARAIAEKLLAGWSEVHPPDDPLTVRVQIDMAHLLRPDEPRRGLEMFTKALSRQRRNLGLHHPGTLMTARGLGVMLRQDGAFGVAYEDDLSTLGQMRRVFGDRHPLTAMAAGNLVLSEILNGHLHDALEREQTLQDGLIRTLGEDHLRVLSSRVLTGVILRELGEYDESADTLQATRRKLVDRYPPNEPDRLDAQRELALTWLIRGKSIDIDKAGRLIRDILPIYRRTYGDTHDDTLACRVAEAIAAHAAGTDDLAARIASDCRMRYREKYRDDHPFVYLAQSNLAIYTRAGRPQDAVALSRTALAGLMDTLDGDHPYLLLAHVNHAALLADVEQGDSDRLAEAAELLAYACDGYDALLGPDHPYTSIANGNLRDVRARISRSPARTAYHCIEWTAPII